MRKKKELRDNAILKGEYPDAYIVEHLTPMRAKVAYKLRNDETVEWPPKGRTERSSTTRQTNHRRLSGTANPNPWLDKK